MGPVEVGGLRAEVASRWANKWLVGIVARAAPSRVLPIN